MKLHFLLLTLVITPILVTATPYQQRISRKRASYEQTPETYDYAAQDYEADYYEYPEAPHASCPGGNCAFDRLTPSEVAEMREIYSDPFSTPSDDVRLKNLIEGQARP